jgi:hypothetical protein
MLPFDEAADAMLKAGYKLVFVRDKTVPHE